MCYRMSEISRHPVVAATRALRFADHVTKRNEGSGNENDVNRTPVGRACAFGLITRALSFRTQVSLVSISAIYFQPATQEE